MATINLNQLTIPIPQPYSRSEPTRNQEDLAFVLLQLLELAKEAGFAVSDQLNITVSGVEVNLTGVENALKDLKFNSLTFDLGDKYRLVFDGRSPSIIDNTSGGFPRQW